MGPNFDIDKGLRSEEELEYWLNRCPIKMLEEFLLKHSIIWESEKLRICATIEKEIEESVVFAKESPYPDPDENGTFNVFKT